MRGKDEQQLDVFSYISPEQRVPHDHPLRPLRGMTDEALRDLQPRFNKLYAKTGRPSIAPEKLLRALLLQALYSVRSERMLMEQLNYNLRSEEHTSELQSRFDLVCRLLLEKKKTNRSIRTICITSRKPRLVSPRGVTR